MRSTRLVHRLRPLGELAGVGLLALGGTLALTERSAAATPQPAASASAPAPGARQLDLTLPPLKMVFTPQQLQALTAPTDDSDMQDVTVRDVPYQIPVPIGTFRALGWALLHPLDAWRIITPVTSQ
jgi:hypothetical protein